MDHQETRDLFTEYHDGDLSDAQLQELEKHLLNCSECDAEWQTFKKTMNEISGLLSLEPPKDVALAVERKIHRRSRGKFFGRGKGSNIQYAIVSFILVLFFMLAWLMLTAVNEIVVLDAEADAGSPAAQKTDP
ncbi:MAG: zf-HC2 domain-containing protein [Deltaproteobacteria bacterium]|nr:zf-HC2 domain-containing protein [Deltaproteobacteria bacterium]